MVTSMRMSKMPIIKENKLKLMHFPGFKRCQNESIGMQVTKLVTWAATNHRAEMTMSTRQIFRNGCVEKMRRYSRQTDSLARKKVTQTMVFPIKRD